MAAPASTPEHVTNARQVSDTSKSKLQKKSDLQRRLEDDVLMASRVGDPVWLEQSLDMMKISLDFEDKDGLSAIHLASLECQLECLKILIEKMNVDVNNKTPDGWTPLHLVINSIISERSFACVDYLLSSGADPSSVTDSGITPMHQAAACGNVPCLRSLIEFGGTIDYEDERGHTPCSLATLWGNRESARILKHYQWQKDKRCEDILKRQMLKEEEIVSLREEEKAKKEKAEKRLRGQKAYQLWLSKNQLGNMPLLFGQHPLVDGGKNDGENGRRSTSRQKTGSSVGRTKKNAISREGRSQERKAEASKKVDFIPINGPGSPLSGKRYAGDYDKRSFAALSSGRIKAVQKRGVLQFPVI